MTLDERADKLRQDARTVGFNLWTELIYRKQEPCVTKTPEELLSFVRKQYDALGKLLESYESRTRAPQ